MGAYFTDSTTPMNQLMDERAVSFCIKGHFLGSCLQRWEAKAR